MHILFISSFLNFSGNNYAIVSQKIILLEATPLQLKFEFSLNNRYLKIAKCHQTKTEVNILLLHFYLLVAPVERKIGCLKVSYFLSYISKADNEFCYFSDKEKISISSKIVSL